MVAIHETLSYMKIIRKTEYPNFEEMWGRSADLN
jgi:hypothetical protein